MTRARPLDPRTSHSRRRRRAAVALPLGLVLLGTVACSTGEGSADGPDPLRSDQWALDALGLPAAHDTSTGCGVTIAVVDSGVDLDHPELREHLVAGIDLVDGDDRPDDENGHGTHVAGIAAAAMDNDTGIVGAAPCADIMPVRVLNADGTGSDDTIAAGIRFAADHGADVINLSLGETGLAGRLRKGGSLNDAMRYANASGSVVVAASGNEGTPRVRNYRPAVPVIVVGAIGPDGTPAEFSNFGDPRTLVAAGRRDPLDGPGDADDHLPGRHQRLRHPRRHVDGRPVRLGRRRPARRPGPRAGRRRADPVRDGDRRRRGPAHGRRPRRRRRRRGPALSATAGG